MTYSRADIDCSQQNPYQLQLIDGKGKVDLSEAYKTVKPVVSD